LPIKQHPTDIWFMQTCRLVPVAALGAMRNFLGGASNFLITSSCDHTIRIWGKVASFYSMQSPVLCSHDMFSLDLHFAVSKRHHNYLFKTMYYSLSWKTHNGQKQEFQEYAQSPG
jgi:WD40 repeat protein